ncbi:NAD-dependent epimerase/dehydratase family protein [Roseiconus nitratireducens]|uniref:NAD-dependent epimerase/dehydratase family protein n=1 Tax=Roseiconus nitratireducens TaxID=2605748 RepID=A0A5M6D4F0_9BACT|nr:NAD-dependent epimerase/dehydratase family protein [Roseiconus nitratireducens]KAA5540065.1 NAD-dependent epimerase/dehydratase family protein [Roseiconus nitratireducens]
MRVLVTGGTGLLGNNIIRQLLADGDQVVALVRGEPEPEVFADLDVELLRAELAPTPPGNPESTQKPGDADAADVSEQGKPAFRDQTNPPIAGNPGTGNRVDGDSDVDVLEAAIAGCDAVIHAAAMIHLGWKHLEESMWINREGTRRIAQACLRHRSKLVHVGTVNTLAVGSRRTVADETTPLEHAGGQIPCSYVQSKRASVEVVLEAVSQGLNAVIVHPGFMLGPFDWKPSSGRMMLELSRGWKPVSPSGGCSLCDVRDVAAATIAAMRTDVDSGRQYILAGHNLTYQQLWTEMARRVGRRPPIRAAGPGMQYLAGLAGDGWTWLTGSEKDVNSAGVAMSAQYHWYDSKRAMQEIGYQIRSAETTLDDAGQWIRERFVLPEDGSDR